MGDPQLRPEERRLKDLLTSLNIVPAEDISRIADEVRLIREYDGQVDLKQRLVDVGLVQARQIDAIERGLGMKAKGAAAEEVKTHSEINQPEGHAYIDMSRLTGSSATGPQAGGFKNLRLSSKAAPISDAGSSAEPVAADAEPASTTKHQSSSLKGSYVPSWKQKRRSHSDEEESPEEAEPSPKESALAEHEKRLQHIVKHIVHTRQHERVLDLLIRRRMNVVEPGEVAENLGIREGDIRTILEDLKRSGVIKDIGTHPYALAPGHRDLEDLKFFFRLWQQGEWHSKILALILEHEKKRG